MRTDLLFYVRLSSLDDSHIGIGIRCFFCDEALSGNPLSCSCGNSIDIKSAETLAKSLVAKAYKATHPGWFKRLLNRWNT